MQAPYSETTIEYMKFFFSQLSEKDRRLFAERLAKDLSIEIRMAHYPPYCSKWNPVEHRVFPHLTRAMQGVILTGHEVVKTLLEKATTRTGLKVVVNIVEKIYQAGRKVADDYKDNIRIVFNTFLGQWNYRAIPSTAPI